jgi:hypothetical protein
MAIMIYTITALSKYLDISRQWLTKQIKRGMIRGEKLSANAYVVSAKEAERVKKYLSKHDGKFPRKKKDL